MSEELVRGTQPPPKRVKFEVVRVTTIEPQTFICLSRSIWGQPVHWNGRRSQQCTKDSSTCPGCKDNMPQKWQGYLHVALSPGSWEGFLEVTQTCWEMIIQQVRPGEHLRGLMIRLNKTKGGPKGRYIVSVLERRLEEAELLKEKDPLPTLEFLWSVKRQAVASK